MSAPIRTDVDDDDETPRHGGRDTRQSGRWRRPAGTERTRGTGRLSRTSCRDPFERPDTGRPPDGNDENENVDAPETDPRRGTAQRADSETGADKGLRDRVKKFFGPKGALARALPGYETREGQRQLADLVAAALESETTLTAEAGTGTGKTIAYLAPAALGDKAVVVSTATKALQDQIIDKDIPAIEAATGRPARAVVLKGLGNYLCKLRLKEFDENSKDADGESLLDLWDDLPDPGSIAEIRDWAGRTRTGDREELARTPEPFAFWREISATTENCVGQSCALYEECWAVKARRAAAEAKITVVNHHLLCHDARVKHMGGKPFLHPKAAVVIDEAHALENIAADAFAVSVSERGDQPPDGERAALERPEAQGRVADR